jgi:hypothetical protein
MGFLNLPEFVKRQILTAAELNQIVTALQGFSASASDIDWPLIAQGDIDFNSQHGIVNLQRFWNVFNGDEYTDLDAAMTAVNSAGGGCLFIPPGNVNDTVTTALAPTQSDILIVGCGTKSILKLGAAAAGPLIQTGTSSLSNIQIANLQLQGGAGAASSKGVHVRRVAGFKMMNVLITGFDGDAIHITNDGTPGNPSQDASISNVKVTGGGSNGAHLNVDDVDGLQVSHFLSETAGGAAITMEPDGSASFITDVIMDNVHVDVPTGKGISILGEASGPDNKWSGISLDQCIVDGPTGTGIELGASSKDLRDLTVSDCSVIGALASGFSISAQRGKVSDCYARAVPATFKGLDLVDSEDIYVSGCNFQDAVTTGIDADGTTDCTLVGNNVRDCGTGILRTGTTTGLVTRQNPGDRFSVGHRYYDDDSHNHTGDLVETDVFTYTIPANVLNKSGDGFRLSLGGTNTIVAGDTTIRVRVNGLGGSTVFQAANTATTDWSGVVDLTVNDVGPNGASNTDFNNLGLATSDAGFRSGDVGVNTQDWTTDTDVVVTVLHTVNTANDGGVAVYNLEYKGRD